MYRKTLPWCALFSAIALVQTYCTHSNCDRSIQDSFETAALVAALCAGGEEVCQDTALEEDLRRVSFYCFYEDAPEDSLNFRGGAPVAIQTIGSGQTSRRPQSGQ